MNLACKVEGMNTYLYHLVHFFFDMESPLVNTYNYYQMIGKLIFFTTTRPNIAYVISVVSCYMAKPQQAHLEAVNHIFKYVKSTLDYGLHYHFSNKHELQGYTNAD